MTCPRGRYDLKLIKTLLSTTPPASVEWTQDVFGNLIATAEFAASSERLVIDSRTVVEQAATNWPAFSIAPSARTYPFQYGAEELLDLGALLLPVADPGNELVCEWARSFLMGHHPDTLTLSKAINEGVHREIRYRRHDEHVTQSATETLMALSGSPRDLATLFIESMRHLGIAARIVSGYVYDAAGAGRQGAAHTWAEIYLPSAGWIAFDPTNACTGSAGLVPVAIGRTIDQVMPVAGGHIGAPEDLLRMRAEVSIVPAMSASQHAAY